MCSMRFIQMLQHGFFSIVSFFFLQEIQITCTKVSIVQHCEIFARVFNFSLKLQYKRTSWLTNQSEKKKKNYPLYWTRMFCIYLLLCTQCILGMQLSGVLSSLGKEKKMSWEEKSGGERLSLSDSEAWCKRQRFLSDNRR